MITAIYKNNKVYLSGEYTTKQLISFKNMGFRLNPKKELYATYDIYLKNRKTLNLEEDSSLQYFLNSLKDKYDKKSIKNYLDNECPLKLFEFQKEFVYWYSDPEKTARSCFNASSAGLGKSVMTLAAVMASNRRQPLVILCPKNAISIWEHHLNLFKYELPIKKEFSPGECACILTYESLNPLQVEANEKKRSLETFSKEIVKGTVLIADEFHKTKSSKTKITKKFKKLFKIIISRDGKCIALTATPIMNRPSEFKTLLDNLDLFKITFGNANLFYKLYGGEFDYRNRRLTWDNTKRNPEAIRKRVKSILFIKNKEEVIEQLPEKIETIIKVPLRKNYKARLDSLGEPAKLLYNIFSPTFEEYMKAREALSLEKIPYIEEVIENYEEQNKPIIVFSCFTKVIETIGNRKGWACLHSKLNEKQIALTVANFNRGKFSGLAVTTGMGSTALSITGTDTLLMADLSLTPGINYQAKNRIDRINALREKLHYIYFISDHPFEQEMHKLILEKEKLERDTLK